MPAPPRDKKPPPTAGLNEYLRRAFLYRWNLLAVVGGAAAALLSPWPDVALPLLLAGELAYLGSIVSFPRFRAAIDAAGHTSPHFAEPARQQAASSLPALLRTLPPEQRRRFDALRARCLEMRQIAHGVRGAGTPGVGDEIRTPALDRLLWVFLRLLLSQHALARFLATADPAALAARTEELRGQLAALGTGDERIARSLQDSVAVAELRLDNYQKAQGNAQFVAIELDRIEAKIQALTEMAINRQDPDVLSSQVDAAAESMHFTESAISELQHITGLADELQEPPPILEADLRMGDVA